MSSVRPTSSALNHEITEWHRVAKAMGIDAEYVDGLGRACTAPLETVRAAMHAMGAPTADAKRAEAWWSDVSRENVLELAWDEAPGVQEDDGHWRIAAPRMHQARAVGRVGAFLPLYALASSRSLGIGDLGDLRALGLALQEQGYDFLATLPLFAVYAEREGVDAKKFDPSPYAPISRSFFSELFLDLRALPEWQVESNEELIAQLQDETKTEHVDYGRVASLRRRILEPMVGCSTGLMVDVDADLRAYARFRAQGDDAAYRYHVYVQRRLREQLETLASSTPMYLDLPVGVHRAGFDAQRFAGDFLSGFSAGAPPDGMFPSGQCWGISALDPHGARRSAYASMRSAVKTLARYAKLLRLDHVMALHRTFCVPDGTSAADGVYIRAHSEELYAALLSEARESAPVLIGEDLGTVPPEVRGAMRSHGIFGMHVMQLDPNEGIPAHACASINTHDLALFASYADGDDLRDYVELGFIAPEDLPDALARRKTMLEGADYASLRAKLLESDAAHVVINLEDEWSEKRPQNTPGTSTERPNFRRRAARRLEGMRAG